MTTIASSASTPDDPRSRLRTAKRRLLGVLLTDAGSVMILAVVAFFTRFKRSGSGFTAIAITAASSLAPGVAAVALEERAHRAGRRSRHGMARSVALFALGMVINTGGTVLVLARSSDLRLSPSAVVVDIALLAGGNVVGVPYVKAVRALHV